MSKEQTETMGDATQTQFNCYDVSEFFKQIFKQLKIIYSDPLLHLPPIWFIQIPDRSGGTHKINLLYDHNK